ncbi:hypothetical protein NUV89_19940 [Pseudomonas sp. 18.1.10]|uniref:hypothetical protein n=1 Tax=Pseudomonas sp. 18.1.10 TaxID=2969302 RepID=UPI00215004E2|nr:hypothetical protein [Pseudomonas sp. 18.1.10]MCR4540661.1 hypothetical protein [Pseudomonas sp. 18.1.10]
MKSQKWKHLKPAPGKKATEYMRGTLTEDNVSSPFSADAFSYINSARTEIAGEDYLSSPPDPLDATGVLAVILRPDLPDGEYHVGHPLFQYAVILTAGNVLHLAESGSLTVINDPNTKEVSGRMHFVAGTVVFDATYNLLPETK